jgi:hypothetical protein
MAPDTDLFEFPDPIPLEFCWRGWTYREIYKRKVDKPDELLARILDPAARTNKCEYPLRRTTRDLRTRAAKCTEVDVEIFEHLM